MTNLKHLSKSTGYSVLINSSNKILYIRKDTKVVKWFEEQLRSACRDFSGINDPATLLISAGFGLKLDNLPISDDLALRIALKMHAATPAVRTLYKIWNSQRGLGQKIQKLYSELPEEEQDAFTNLLKCRDDEYFFDYINNVDKRDYASDIRRYVYKCLHFIPERFPESVIEGGSLDA